MKKLLEQILRPNLYGQLQRVYGMFRLGCLDWRRRTYEMVGSYKYSKVALSGLDDQLKKYLNFRGGVFIEAGANDGVSQSNTYYLEKALGWQGVLVEPIPRLFRSCQRNRKRSVVYNSALISPDKEGTDVTICESECNGLMSRVVEDSTKSEGRKTVICGRTLTSILVESGLQQFDFFSLDVEGYELSVLDGLDLARLRPTYILVETAQVEKVDQRLCQYYNRIEQLSHHDYLYRTKN